MPVETLKGGLVGWLAGACALPLGELEYTHSTAKCRYQAELSVETLVWTRGRILPLAGRSSQVNNKLIL